MKKPDKRLDILLIEDEITDADLLVRELDRAGLHCSATRVDTEAGLREALRSSVPDIVLSDFTLQSEFDGMAALAIVREMLPDTPFVFVSGTIGQDRAIEAIKGGATDYVLKGNLGRLPLAVSRALEEAEQKRRWRSTQQALQRSKDRLHSLLGALNDVVWSVAPDGAQLFYINACAARVYGRPVEQLQREPQLLFAGILGDDRERFDLLWQATLAGGTLDIEYRVQRPDRSIAWLHHRAWPVVAPGGDIVRVDAILRDVTQDRQYREQIQYLAAHDELTDLPNRTLLHDRLRQAIAQAARGERRFAVLFLDLDRFKQINDRYGHAIGDKVLQAVANRLRGVLRRGDTVARTGGDEFVMVLVDTGDSVDIAALADRLLGEAFTVPFLVDGLKLSLQASLGVS